MKNMKNKKYGINILMIALILIMIPAVQASVSAERSIENNTLIAGNSTNITVVIQNDDMSRSLSLKEIIPSDWNLTRISDDANQFKASTNEWVWLTVENNTAKTVIYQVTVPSDTVSGTYNIDGFISTNENMTNVTGDSTITVINNNTVVPPTNESFNFSVSPSTQTVNVGTDAQYTLTIGNPGSVEDIYSLVTDNPDNANVTLDNDNVTVAAGDSASLMLTVNGSVTGTYTVNVTATSANTSNMKNVTTTTVVTAPPVVPIGGFSFNVSPSAQTVNVGSDAQYTLTIGNPGSTEDTYSLVTDNPDNATVNLDNDNITVAPGGNSDLTLTVSSSVTGTFTVNVTATSANTSNSSDVTTMTNVVVPVTQGHVGAGSSSGGTYPTFTATPQKTAIATPVMPTQTTVSQPVETTVETTEQPVETTTETPMPTATKAPGFGIVIAIGVFAAIYIMRRKK